MNKYQRGKIYKIVSDSTDDVYIGSTTEPTLARRLAKHKGNYNEYLKGKHHFITSFKILETGSYDIVLLESYPCNSKDELHKKERECIENTPNCVNKVIPTRTLQEYGRHYREQNKESITAQRKQFREQNRTKLAQASQNYYNANKERIAITRAEKKTCDCGSVYNKYEGTRHFNTKKHQNYIKSLTE